MASLDGGHEHSAGGGHHCLVHLHCPQYHCPSHNLENKVGSFENKTRSIFYNVKGLSNMNECQLK